MNAFGPLAAHFFDASHVLANDDTLAAYESILPAEGLLLDVMCGSGRLLVPWVRRGAKVHGVDSSAPMLALCESHLAAAGVTTPLVRQDVTALNLPFRYAGALVAGGALQYLTDPASVAAALARLHAHLLAPGVLVVDFSIPPTSRQKLAAPLVEIESAQLADGSRITRRSETVWTPDARLARGEQRYTHRWGTGQIAEEHATVRSTWYTPEDAIALVASAGFVAEATASVIDGDGATSFRVIARPEA